MGHYVIIEPPSIPLSSNLKHDIETLFLLAREISPAEFSKLLEKQVYPLLDDLPSMKRANLLKALEERTRKSVVDYKAKDKELWKKIRALEKHVEDNCKNGSQVFI
jgi:hypothetical protein